MASPNADLAISFYRAVESGSVDSLTTILAPDWEEIPLAYPGQPPGVNGYAPVVQTFKAAFPDGRFQIEDVIEAGTKVVIRTTVHGTHQGAFLGVEPTHKPISFATIDIHEIADNKIVRSWHIEDFFGLLQQINPSSP
ncbi:ester cyclase [Oscillatoria sp. FACHB-1407]|uniref:ester cyclase n=1 Tax=Oscillatoria sp. FACHB-1407 TaxID=2692847 RepID=UPI001687EC74|nr:ester cyclase [Oscillatoria sp. FACHB-1407]MBD2460266.1 ester cyclase [Oscillatoria sp. FACHB-1407]